MELAGAAGRGAAAGAPAEGEGDITGAGTERMGAADAESVEASGTEGTSASIAAAFLALGRAGCVGRVARPGESVVRRFLGTELVGFVEAVFLDAAFLGAVSPLPFVFFRVLLGRFFAAFFAAFLGAFAGRFFAAFFGAFVDARFAAGRLLVFFVAIASPETGTLSESSRLATATVSLSSPPRTRTRCVRGVPAPSRQAE